MRRRVQALVVCTVAVVLSGKLGGAQISGQRPGGLGEGVKVHGDWTIVVRQPDGIVASRYVFRNGLVSSNFLARLLQGDSRNYGFNIFLGSFSASPGPLETWCDETGTSFCRIVPPNTSFPMQVPGVHPAPIQTFTSPTLAVTRTNDVIELNGSITARRAGEIRFVSVLNVPLIATGVPLVAVPFTSRDLAGIGEFRDYSPTVAIAAGQIVDVTVVLSFQ